MPLLLASPNPDRTVVNVSSAAANSLILGSSSHSSGKLALLRFMEFFNAEEDSRGILAFAMHPGAVGTEMGNSMPEDFHPMLKVGCGVKARG